MLRPVVVREPDGCIVVQPPASLSGGQKAIIISLSVFLLVLGILAAIFFRDDRAWFILGPIVIAIVGIIAVPVFMLRLAQAKGPYIEVNAHDGRIRFPRIDVEQPLDQISGFARVRGWYRYKGGDQISWLTVQQLFVEVGEDQDVQRHLIWDGDKLPEQILSLITDDLGKPIAEHNFSREEATDIRGIIRGI